MHIPFPVGTVRGPYRNHKTVTFMVQGENGWIPFGRPIHQEGECEKAAKEYAGKLLTRG